MPLVSGRIVSQNVINKMNETGLTYFSDGVFSKWKVTSRPTLRQCIYIDRHVLSLMITLTLGPTQRTRSVTGKKKSAHHLDFLPIINSYNTR